MGHRDLFEAIAPDMFAFGNMLQPFFQSQKSESF